MEILGLVSVPGWLVALLTLFLTVYIYGRHKHSYFKTLGIRSVPGTLMLGSMPAMFKKGFNCFDSGYVEEYGKVFGYYLGNVPMLIVADTEIIKEITVKQFNKFSDRFILGPLKPKWYSAVSLATGSHWKFLRSTLSPTFSSGKMRNMTPLIELCLRDLRSIIEEKARENKNGFDIVPFLNGLTMDVICSTSFGIQVNAQTDQNNTFVQHAKKLLEVNFLKLPVFILSALVPELEFIFKVFPADLISNGTLEYLKSATMSAFAERKESDSSHKDLLQLMINAHKGEAGSSNDDGYTYDDFKKRGLTDEEVLINSIIFMAAGYETTAAALSWCIYDLVNHIDVQERLLQEIDTELGETFPNYDNVAKLPYMDMVMNETLRMHPPTTRSNRLVMEDTVINGVQFKKGMVVDIPIVTLHFMAEYWEKPDEYNPERFAADNQDKVDQYAFIPFGQGPRQCLAVRLVHLEIKMTIASLLQKYRFVKADELQVPMPMNANSIARPSKPVMVKLVPRKQ